MIKFKNIVLAIKDQMPLRRFVRNLFKGHLLGAISKRSHVRANGKLKVKYNSKSSAQKAADVMSEKYGGHYSNYKCIYCDGYHLGRNRENK